MRRLDGRGFGMDRAHLSFLPFTLTRRGTINTLTADLETPSTSEPIRRNWADQIRKDRVSTVSPLLTPTLFPRPKPHGRLGNLRPAFALHNISYLTSYANVAFFFPFVPFFFHSPPSVPAPPFHLLFRPPFIIRLAFH